MRKKIIFFIIGFVVVLILSVMLYMLYGNYERDAKIKNIEAFRLRTNVVDDSLKQLNPSNKIMYIVTWKYDLLGCYIELNMDSIQYKDAIIHTKRINKEITGLLGPVKCKRISTMVFPCENKSSFFVHDAYLKYNKVERENTAYKFGDEVISETSLADMDKDIE